MHSPLIVVIIFKCNHSSMWTWLKPPEHSGNDPFRHVILMLNDINHDLIITGNPHTTGVWTLMFLFSLCFYVVKHRWCKWYIEVLLLANQSPSQGHAQIVALGLNLPIPGFWKILQSKPLGGTIMFLSTWKKNPEVHAKKVSTGIRYYRVAQNVNYSSEFDNQVHQAPIWNFWHIM